MSTKLPPVTHLQFLILEALDGDEQAGRDLRALLAQHGVRNSAPAFYQMMGRLEDARLVEGWYEQKRVAGQHVKERRYRLTAAGLRSLTETRNFYLRRLSAGQLSRRNSNA